MSVEFHITVHLGEDVVFAPGVDGKFLAAELAAFTTRLMNGYSSGAMNPEISVSVPELPEPPQPNVTIV